MNYDSLAKDVLNYVGGKKNVIDVEHCMTRLRFNLVDNKIVDSKKLERLEGVIAVKNSVGQIQVVIGNEVAEVYNKVITMVDENNHKTVVKKKKKNIGGIILDFITSAMLLCMPVMCASGLIKGLNVLLSMFGIYSQDSGLYLLVNGVGDAIFYFFPILVGYNAAKKLNMTPFLGLTIGAILCYPSINGVELNVFGQSVTASYTSTFFPIIVLVLIAAPLEKRLNKVIPNAVKTFLVPTIVLLLVVPLGFVFIGPAANQIGTFISTIFIRMYDLSPILTGFVLGGTILLLIVFGLHTVIGLSNYLNVIQGIPDPIMPLKSFSTFALTSAVFAVYLRTKNKKIKNVALPATISGLLGVTEPGLYGVAVPNVNVFVFASLGSALGGIVAALFHMKAYAFTGSGFFTFLGFLKPDDPTVFPIILGLAVSGIFSFVTTMLFYKDKNNESLSDDVTSHSNKSVIKILSPVSGNVSDIKEAHDDAFSSSVVGDGVVIVPSEGMVFSPFDGEVKALFPTKHAIGLISNDGIEMLIHIGEDTVNLDGEGFVTHVKQGDIVKQGQILIEFDLKLMCDKGFNIETPVLITNREKYKIVRKEFGNTEALFNIFEVEDER